MTIEVKRLHDFDSDDVCVVVDGYCNHAATDDELDEFVDGVDYSDGDILTHEEAITVCRKCHAWKYLYDTEWHDENIQDELEVKETNGQLVQF